MKAITTKLHKNTVLLVALALCAVIATGCQRQDRASADAPAKPANSKGSPGNRVLNLDGKTASIRVPDSPSFHTLTNAMTMEAWCKASSFYEQPGAVNSILRKNVAASQQNFFLRFRIGMGKQMIEMCAGIRSAIMLAPYDFEPDHWYHLAGTCGDGVMTVLVNGVTVRSQRAFGLMDIDESDLFIGKGDPNFSFGEYFHGALDEIRIWNIARSPEQIRASMNARLTGKEPGLVAYWNFDDGTSKDVSGHGNNGTLDGNARIEASASPAAQATEQPKK